MLSSQHFEEALDFPPVQKILSDERVPAEVLVVAASFEARGLAFAKRASAIGPKKAIVVEYSPHNHANRTAETLECAKTLGFSVTSVTYDPRRLEKFCEKLRRTLERHRDSRVVIDISAMTKLAILLILDVACELNVDTAIIYSEAGHYGPTQAEYEAARRHKGVPRALFQPSIRHYAGLYDVIRCNRLSSVAMQGQPCAAIMFMSFNELLTQAVIDSVFPSRLFLINGGPPVLHWREEATAWIHDQLRQEWSHEDNPLVAGCALPVRSTSTLHYGETISVLLELYWRLATDYRVMLSPTGSKMQAVACYLVEGMHRDIHVEYPTPHGVLSCTTEGVGQGWQIGFGRLGDLIRAMRTVERRSLLTEWIQHSATVDRTTAL